MPTTVTYLDSLTILIPLLIAISTLFTAMISTMGLIIGKKSVKLGEKSDKSINEIHVIVNSQRSQMSKEIDILSVKCELLAESNIELKKLMLEMPKVLLVSKETEEAASKAIIELKPVESLIRQK